MTPAQFWAIESQNQQNKMQRMDDLADQVGSGAGRLASAAAGFAMGGPAGAAMAMQGGGERGGRGGGGSSPDSVLGSFVSAYADNKALEAKGEAYGDFMNRHGEQLGFKPEYLQDFLKKPKREQAMIGDQIIGMQNTGRQIMNQQYLKQQADAFGGRGGGGAGGGTQPGVLASF